MDNEVIFIITFFTVNILGIGVFMTWVVCDTVRLSLERDRLAKRNRELRRDVSVRRA